MQNQYGDERDPTLTPLKFIVTGVRRNWWAWLFVIGFFVAYCAKQFLWLKYVHVFAAMAWTGTDLFLAVVLGPILRRSPLPLRVAVLRRVLPGVLFYMPVIAIVTVVAGWYLAMWKGAWVNPAMFPWFVAALVLVGIMLCLAFGVIIPHNWKMFWEIESDNPDLERVKRLADRYRHAVTVIAACQILVIYVMIRL